MTTVTLQLDGAPVELVVALVRVAGVQHFVRDEQGLYSGMSLPMTLAELELFIVKARGDNAKTDVIERVAPDPVVIEGSVAGQRWAYCPDHPEWEPLTRGNDGETLRCTAPRRGREIACLYWTLDPGRRYANG